MSDLGVRVERQTNLRVEWLAQSARASQAARPAQPAYFELDPPTDVRLVTDMRGDRYGANFPARAVYRVPSATLAGRSPIAAASTAWRRPTRSWTWKRSAASRASWVSSAAWW